MAKAKTELRVTGLIGQGRVSKAEETLSGIPGVEYAHVNLGAGKATVHFEDSVAQVDALIAALKQAGFDASQE